MPPGAWRSIGAPASDTGSASEKREPQSSARGTVAVPESLQGKRRLARGTPASAALLLSHSARCVEGNTAVPRTRAG